MEMASKLSCLLLATTALATSLPAAAQTEAEETGRRLDAIIVTAQKQAQDILDVGANVTAFSADDIAIRRIEQVGDFAAALANVDIKEIAPGTLPIISIRGVGLNDWSATNNPSAGIYVDEVPVSSLVMMNFDLFDIDRMEALKGPQGTLYGRNSTAGALNIHSARPTTEGVSGYLSGGYGSYETATGEGWVNQPLGETVAVRLSGKVINQGKGFFYNSLTDRDYGRRDILLGRAQIRWQPSDDADINLKVERQRSRSEGGNGEFFGAFPPNPVMPGVACPGDSRCRNLFGYSDTDGDPFTGAYSVDPTYNLDQTTITFNASYDLGWATVTSVTGHADFERTWGADVDASPLPIADYVEQDDIEQFSQELRLSGNLERLNWLAGFFYSTDTIQGTYDGNLKAIFNTTTLSGWDQTAHSAAAFGQVEYDLTPEVSLVGGVRYTEEKKKNTGFTEDLATSCPASFLTRLPCGAGPLRIASVNATIDNQDWSWKGGINWKPADNLLVYASVSSGMKSGGFFSGFATTSSALQPYRPESLLAYEAGTKGRTREFDWSASVFHYDYEDVQTFIRDESGVVPVQRLGNVDEATLSGLDFDLGYQPEAIDGLRLSAGLGLLDTELGAFLSSNGLVPAGNKMANAPETTLTLGGQYEFPLTAGWTAQLSTNGRYVSETYKDAQNLELLKSGDYWLMDARAGASSQDGWTIALWAKNLRDERYVTHGTNLLTLGFGSRIYGAPRTYGISVSRHF